MEPCSRSPRRGHWWDVGADARMAGAWRVRYAVVLSAVCTRVRTRSTHPPRGALSEYLLAPLSEARCASNETRSGVKQLWGDPCRGVGSWSLGVDAGFVAGVCGHEAQGASVFTVFEARR